MTENRTQSVHSFSPGVHRIGNAPANPERWIPIRTKRPNLRGRVAANCINGRTRHAYDASRTLCMVCGAKTYMPTRTWKWGG